MRKSINSSESREVSLPLADLESRRPRRLLYWFLQVFGWSTYFGYWAAFVALPTHNARLLAFAPVLMLSHLFASHGLRAVIRRNGWINFPAGKLFWRLAGMSFLLAVAVEVVITPVGVLMRSTTLRAQFENSWYYALFSFVLFGIWSILYIAFQSYFRYRESEFQRLQLQASLREAELRALKAQVNPHFLFNCLNNVRSLVVEDGERAREMLLRLSELLRYALDSGQRERVPLSRELEVVRAYLDLEKLQFEERLHWRIEGPSDAMDAMVPPMLIQQLVENAIKHGIEKQAAGGEITVRASSRCGPVASSRRKHRQIGSH